VAGAALVATNKYTNESKDNRVITDANVDTVNYLTAEESANLINNDTVIRDEIAAGLYYKDIGSREGLSVAESDIQYTDSSDTVKRVYRNKAITDIRKLVAEGIIKIERSTLDVQTSIEKVSL